MSDSIVSGNRIKKLLGDWAEDALWIKAGAVIDLTRPGAVEAAKDAMRESIREYFGRRGIIGLGVGITLRDDVEVADHSGLRVEQDLVTIDCHYQNLSASITLGWGGLTGSGFDIDGDGK